MKSRSEESSELKIELTIDEQQQLLALARQSIADALEHKNIERFKATPNSKIFGAKYGLFVTLHLKGRLRGCIGHIAPQSFLFEEIQDVARLSAFEDPRFPALAPAELDQVDIEITILSPMLKINDPDLVEPGKHGLLIRNGYHQGLLLPQVATEHGWDRETFLQQTCLKAGLAPDVWQHPKTELTVFTAYIFSEMILGVG